MWEKEGEKNLHCEPARDCPNRFLRLCIRAAANSQAGNRTADQERPTSIICSSLEILHAYDTAAFIRIIERRQPGPSSISTIPITLLSTVDFGRVRDRCSPLSPSRPSHFLARLSPRNHSTALSSSATGKDLLPTTRLLLELQPLARPARPPQPFPNRLLVIISSAGLTSVLQLTSLTSVKTRILSADTTTHGINIGSIT